MKVTVKGQVTIPQALRERFGLNPGTEVEFVASDQGLQLKPQKNRKKSDAPFAQWISKAAGSAKTKSTTDEIMAVTRGED